MGRGNWDCNNQLLSQIAKPYSYKLIPSKVQIEGPGDPWSVYKGWNAGLYPATIINAFGKRERGRVTVFQAFSERIKELSDEEEWVTAVHLKVFSAALRHSAPAKIFSSQIWLQKCWSSGLHTWKKEGSVIIPLIVISEQPGQYSFTP